MGDRPESSSRGRMSEDKVRRKDWCWSVRAVYVLGKLSDVSGPSLEEAGRYMLDLGGAFDLGGACEIVSIRFSWWLPPPRWLGAREELWHELFVTSHLSEAGPAYIWQLN